MNGTITKQPIKDGKFSCGYDFGVSQNGKRRQYTKSGFETKREACDALRDAILEASARCEAAPPRVLPTFGDFFARWIQQHASRRCSPTTLEAYCQHGAYAIRGSEAFRSISLPQRRPKPP
jgi:hypothetical protein